MDVLGNRSSLWAHLARAEVWIPLFLINKQRVQGFHVLCCETTWNLWTAMCSFVSWSGLGAQRAYVPVQATEPCHRCSISPQFRPAPNTSIPDFRTWFMKNLLWYRALLLCSKSSLAEAFSTIREQYVVMMCGLKGGLFYGFLFIRNTRHKRDISEILP